MKIAIQYLSDINVKTNAVQLPLTEWEKIVAKLKKYEQALEFKADLKDAFEEVAVLKKTKIHKQTLKEFLNEL